MTISLLAAPVVRDPKWADRALCSYDEWPDLWHPDGTTSVSAIQQAAEAKRICNLCPVRKDCLDDALETEGARKPDGRYGIRGGFNEDERYRLHRRIVSAAST